MKNIPIVLILLVLIFSCKQENKVSELSSNNLNGNISSIKSSLYKAIVKEGEIIRGEVSNKSYDNTIMKYDEYGNSSHNQYLLPDGTVKETTTFENSYDENGMLVKVKAIRGNGRTMSIRKFSYNDKGLVGEEEWFDENNNQLFKQEYRYDENGNKTQETYLNTDGSISDKTIFIYNDLNQNVEYTNYSAEGVVNFKSTFVYDEQGNVLKTYNYKPDGSIRYTETYSYKYDDKNNWIEKVRYSKDDNKPMSITAREITYF